MYPNEPRSSFPEQPTGIDYLNQIAAPPPAQGFDKKTKIIMIILGIVGVLGLILIFIMAQQTSRNVDPSQMAARVNKLLTVSQKYNKKLQSNEMQSTNSSLISVLTTAEASLTTPLKDAGIDYAKQKKEIIARDPSTAIEKKLDEAALNAQLDIAYAHEMNVQITDTIALMQRLRKATNSTSTREYLVKTIADLQGIQKQLTKIISTSAS